VLQSAPVKSLRPRKNRSAEQALLLLQEHFYNAWRTKKVLGLVSFDVKGAYNVVYKDRLLQRLTGRSIPPALVRWIGAFCSQRLAIHRSNLPTYFPAVHFYSSTDKTRLSTSFCNMLFGGSYAVLLKDIDIARDINLRTVPCNKTAQA
jgi:hypothetical protein